MDAILHGYNYIIRLKTYGQEIEAMFLVEYKTIFSERYENIFLAKDGNIYKWEEVESWRLKK